MRSVVFVLIFSFCIPFIVQANDFPTPDDMDSTKKLYLTTQAEPNIPKEHRQFPLAPHYSKIFDDLKRMGEEYGFRLTSFQGAPQFAARDGIILNGEGTLLASTSMSLRRSDNFQSAFKIEYQLLDKVGISALKEYGKVDLAALGGSGMNHQRFPEGTFEFLTEIWGMEDLSPYLEGGNTFFATNKNGDRLLILPKNAFEFNSKIDGTEKVKAELVRAFKLRSPEHIVLLDLPPLVSAAFFPHIDMFMTIGPKGHILIQDYNLTLGILKSLKRVDVELIKLSDKIARIATPALDIIRKQLESAGFEVHSVPGVYHGSDVSPMEPLITLFNGISGYSPIKDQYYFITAGVFLKNRDMSEAIMSSFSDAVQSIIKNITQKDCDVRFIGADDDKSFKTTQNEVTKAHAGLHCLTVPLALAHHMEDPQLDDRLKKQEGFLLRKSGNLFFKKKEYEKAATYYMSSRNVHLNHFVDRNLALCLTQMAEQTKDKQKKQNYLNEAKNLILEAKTLAGEDTEFLNKLKTNLDSIEKMLTQ